MESKKLRLYEYDKIIPKELNLNFSLSELEQKIFSFFISNDQNNSTFRVAGGWFVIKFYLYPMMILI